MIFYLNVGTIFSCWGRKFKVSAVWFKGIEQTSIEFEEGDLVNKKWCYMKPSVKQSNMTSEKYGAFLDKVSQRGLNIGDFKIEPGYTDSRVISRSYSYLESLMKEGSLTYVGQYNSK